MAMKIVNIGRGFLFTLMMFLMNCAWATEVPEASNQKESKTVLHPIDSIDITQKNEILLSSLPSPFEAEYTAFRFNRELGEASIKLRSIGNDMYQLQYHSKVSLFFLSDERHESSLFRVKDDHILPYKYSYQQTGTGSDKVFTAEFKPEQKLIIASGDKQLDWDGHLDNQLYRLDFQRRLAEDNSSFNYKFINYRGQSKEMVLAVIGSELLELPYGKLETIKVKIIRKPNNRRETFIWFAPALNYQLVRLQQFKDGDEQGDIRLKQFVWN
jgi:hypothetical protein